MPEEYEQDYEDERDERDDDGLSEGQMAAVIVMALGEEVASDVMRHLSQKDIKKLSTQIAMIGDVDQAVINRTIEAFQDELAQSGALMPGGSNFLRGAVTRALGSEAGARLLEEIEAETSSLEVLEDVDSRTLASILQKEHPQTIALVMAHTEVGKASDVVSLLSDDLQLDVIYRMARLDAVSSEILQEVEQALLDEIHGMSGVGSHVAGGVQLVADILNQMDKSTEGRILETIDARDPEMADEIRELMFVFDDLMKIDDRGVQTLLKEVDNDTLVLALRTAAEAIRTKVFKNISQRAAQRIADDLENMGPTRLSDVEGAQAELVRTALRLEEEGRLSIMREGGEDQFV